MKSKSFDLSERSRNWNLLLYEEDETHKQALEIIKTKYKFGAILHNMDVYEENSENHAKGEIKKEHYHIVIKLPNARTRKSLITELGINANYVEKCGDINKSLEYLVHANNLEKYQYNINDVFGDLKVQLNELLNNKDKSESEKIMEIFTYIDSCRYLKVSELAKWTASNGYWAEFRRSQTIMLAYLQEHNNEYRSRDYEN